MKQLPLQARIKWEKTAFLVIASVVLSLGTGGCDKKSDIWQPVPAPLMTRWSNDVSVNNALPEYPRPQMMRSPWQNLNGLWNLAITGINEEQPKAFPEAILVPYPIESALSGVRRRIDETQKIWYKRTFSLPRAWRNKHILLHFEAVDWEAEVFLDGQRLGRHRGGYDAFSFDITDHLKKKKRHEIIVSVWDPSDQGGQPAGKQRKKPHGIFYTPTSGIWQTVWIEPVPESFIQSFRIIPDADAGSVKIQTSVQNPKKLQHIQYRAIDKNDIKTEATGVPGEETTLPLPHAHLWSPKDPYLYDLEIELLDTEGNILDRIKSYFALRKISLGLDQKGRKRLLLNNNFLFQFGPLDQGFWPDGLYTAPTDEALRFDIEAMKAMGFNMVRKHVKVEPERWYYWCDTLGLLVWQDMPSGKNKTPQEKAQFERELKRLIQSRFNHPSIIMWVPFNEGWGQYDSARIISNIKKWDPTRLVDHASGWTDKGAGDVHDIHSYPEPKSPVPEKTRAAVLGEFGGLGFNVQSHTWEKKGWGYDQLQDKAGMIQRYQGLLNKLFPLIDNPGLSAAVYTQITDIETENNGLLTYDRKVNKMGRETVAQANAVLQTPAEKKSTSHK